MCQRAVVSDAHDSIVCTAPPRHVAFDTVVVVRTATLASNAVAFDYDAPVVLSVSPTSTSALPSVTRERLRVIGYNFGVVWPGEAGPHSVAIGNATCAAVSWLSDSELLCLLDVELRVGSHAVTVAVRDASSERRGAVVRAVCPEDTFGTIDGERCLSCPEGAVCYGGDSDPVARAGFYPASRTQFVQCQPREACLGGKDNACRTWYEGERCATCARGAYR